MASVPFLFSQACCGTLSLVLTLLFSLFDHAGAAVTRDGTMGTGPAGPVTKLGNDYQIPSTDGTRAGTNLFHSFSQFNLVQGESATFSNSGAPLNNVIARVIGGPSSIDGLIRSTIDGAHLFFLNPAGVMFGPNASLDVPGSFHVSTADYLKFTDGTKFYANPSSTSVLSVADPLSFGFLGPSQATISGDNSYLEVKEGQTLSIIGGDIIFKGTPVSIDDLMLAPALLTAPGGTINLVSAASPGEVRLSDMGLENFNRLGKITFSQGAKLDVTNQEYYDNTSPYYWYPKSSGGNVSIRGGEMIFRDGGIDAYGNPGGSIDVIGANLHLDNFYFFPTNFNWWFDPGNADQSHSGTACRIDLAGDLLMTHAAFIDTQNIGAGKGGSVNITAKNVLLGDEVIDGYSYTGTVGFYGYIGCSSFGSAPSGNIDIVADNMTLRNGFFVATQCQGDGDAGDVSVTVANTLAIKDQGIIGIMANGFGKGGVLSASARDIEISAANEANVTEQQTMTGILGQTSYLSNGGQIKVQTDNLRLLDGGQISSVLYDLGYGALGKGTDITIDAGEMVVSGYVADHTRPDAPFYYSSSVDARVYGSAASGQGGNIAINTDNLNLTNGGNIRSALDFDAPGNAGTINIQAANIDISRFGRIYADSDRGTGNSGNIDITAQSMNITGTPEVLSSPFDVTFTGLSTSTKAGNLRGKGAINVNLIGDLTMNAGGGIKADTSGSTDGGEIDITARNILLNDQASINASSNGSGNAGDIKARAANTLLLRTSSITTEASVDADGGNIDLFAPYMVRLVDSWITSSVGGGPETTGGNISIDPQFVILQNSQIIAQAFEGTGGNIALVADIFLQDPASIISASSALGVSGTVHIQAPISNVSGVIAPLSSDYVSATDLLRERCITRVRQGKYSSFIVGGRDGLPPEPGNLMPSISY